MILYHGTSSRFKAPIMRHGLRPRKDTGRSVYEGKEAFGRNLESHPDLIYLTDSYAIQFARLAVTTYGGGLFVATVKVEEDDLLPDTDFDQDKTGIAGLEHSGTCCVRAEVIRPVGLYLIDKRDADKIFPETRIWAGLRHRAMGPQSREAQNWLIVAARKRFYWDGEGWDER